MNLLTTRDIALRLTISEAEACRLVREGKIPHVKIDGRRNWRVRPEDLTAYIKSKRSQCRCDVCNYQRDCGLPTAHDAETGAIDEIEPPQVTPSKGRHSDTVTAARVAKSEAYSKWIQRYTPRSRR